MVHVDFLIEDKSGEVMLKALINKILPANVSSSIYSYKGVGRIPGHLHSAGEIKSQQLLINLPKLLSGFGKTYKGWGKDYQGVVVVICDLDSHNLKNMLTELNKVLKWCNPRPCASFCIAIEEGEAWLLGDVEAVKSAFPNANMPLLKSYQPDSICGTWEKLADILGYDYKGKSFVEIGTEKSKWAAAITPLINIEKNRSPSFQHFVQTLRKITIKLSPDKNKNP